MRLVVVLITVAACSGGRADRPASKKTAAAPNAAIRHDAGPTSSKPPTPHISELEARQLLSRLFRDAGFRIVHDVRLDFGGAAVTADGWDPERSVGFEYIASQEKDTDVTEAERAAAGASDSHRLLILDSMGAEPIERQARAFLESELARRPDAGK